MTARRPDQYFDCKGTAEEIAKMAMFLVSDAAAHATGESVVADGGDVHG
jgi:enoyl-[acyl-carrier-protein] reductase (NADH)